MIAGKWIVLGGAGYIGAHLVRDLDLSGVNVVVADNFSSGIKERIPQHVKCWDCDVFDSAALEKLFRTENPIGVVYLVGLKNARESMADAFNYWNLNVGGLLALLGVIRKFEIKHFLFSSSCSVFGSTECVDSGSRYSPTSPYGRTKMVSELVLKDVLFLQDINLISLRYFNVIGNDNFPFARDGSKHCILPSAFNSISSNISPRIFGGSLPTKDGTCLRDYLDVRDLSRAHFKAMEILDGESLKSPCSLSLNLGSGKPTSVLDVLSLLSKEMNWNGAFDILPANTADPISTWSDVSEAKRILNWEPKIPLLDSIRDFLDSVKAFPLNN